MTHSECNNAKGGDMPMLYLRRMAEDLHIVFEYLSKPRTKLNQRQRKILNGEGD